MPRWLTCVVLVLGFVLGITADARADGVLHNSFGIPRADDGRGLKVGERATFHAGFALGTGVDTNVYSNARRERKVASAFLWPSAWLGIGNRELRDGLLMSPPERSGRWIDYNISTLGGFRQYLARSADTRSVPKFSIGVQLRLTLLPGRRFSTQLDADYFRGAAAGNYQDDGRVFNFNRHDARARLMFTLRPGGGRLSFGVGGRVQFLRFDGDSLFKSNRVVPGLVHETKWRFLPRSAVVLSYTMDFSYYTDCCTETDRGRNEDNFAHRLLVGYRGQVVDKLALDAMVGWGGAFYRQDKNGPDFNSVIGHVSVNYFPTLRSVVSLSLTRNYQDSLFGNFFIDNGVQLALGHQFRWRMIGHLGASVAARRVRGLPVPQETPTGENYVDPETADINNYDGRGADTNERRTTIVGLSAKLEQPLGKILALSLGYNMYADTRPYGVSYIIRDPATGEEALQRDDISFTRHIVTLIFAVRI
ncbi:MAG: hypothetical protein IAG13_01305 [Deltaproteobacteria bacterium]|nr:hypothetical protein [Nannocystaceae bacterium]